MSSLLVARRRLLLANQAPPGGGGGDGEATVVHTLDWETGNLNQIAGVTPSGSGHDWGVQQGTVRSGTHAAFMTLNNSSAGDAIRFRIDNNLDGSQSEAFGGFGWNLPRDAYYSSWVYIPQYIDMGGSSPWNIFQFKQNTDHSTNDRMTLCDNFDVLDRGAGNDYGVHIKSVIHDDGHWSHSNKPSWKIDQPLLAVGEWNHIEWHRIWSDDPDVGLHEIRVNGTEIFSINRRTFLSEPMDQTSRDFDDWNPNRRFQWTINSYHTGGSGTNHNPNTHTLYWDDGYVATGGWVGMDGP